MFPTHSLRNLQRLYGLLPGINVAVKVPPRGVKKPIRVLGVFGDTIARMTRKVRARVSYVCRLRAEIHCRTFPFAGAASSTSWTTSSCRTSSKHSTSEAGPFFCNAHTRLSTTRAASRLITGSAQNSRSL